MQTILSAMLNATHPLNTYLLPEPLSGHEAMIALFETRNLIDDVQRHCSFGDAMS
ncbi:MAG: hypothetical protein OEZ58_01560 [Gammaproteobacteria bacterium]|nr:hypothetical protein [Gammaproteobacteria bacterium]MDH5727648.1 hypothetical protein [Gammaproteobacteria bacterium]